MRFSLPSFAKINWTLKILGKREDGFHELFTIFQTISLYDRLSFETADGLSLSSNRRYLPTDERNLVIKAAMALKTAYNVKEGAIIRLNKLIPSPGGLGGGSSNAAVALFGLSRLWNLNVSDQELVEFAGELGSDVSFFIYGGTAIGLGRGEVIEPIGDIDRQNLLVVTPRTRVSTSAAFARISVATLTNQDLESILPVCRKEATEFDPVGPKLINDFEESVFYTFPEVKRVKDTLLELGAVGAALSGSGASVFAIFDNQETRQTALKALDEESTWRKFAVATVPRSRYREIMHRHK